MPPRRLLLDTDIGTNVDDALALGVALASDEARLSAVTTVHGDVMLRSRIAMKLLRLARADHVQVARGADLPLSQGSSVYWEGHEGVGLLDSSDLALQPAAGHAVDLIIREALAHPGETWLVAIGPLTNVALALLKEPGLGAALAGITVMGGVAGEGGELPVTDRNFRTDPEAARAVLAAGVPVHVVPLAITRQVRLEAADVAAIAATGDSFHEALARQVDLYPAYRKRGGWTYLHDPLTLASVLAPDLVEWEPVRGQVQAGPAATHPGQLLLESGAAEANIRLARRVRAGTAHDWIMDRLTRPLAT